jgi:hypothetical protein
MGVDGMVGRARSCEFLPGLPSLVIRAPSSTWTSTSGAIRRPSNTAPAMSALPRSIGSRVLAPALRPSTARAVAPAYRAYSTPNKTSSSEAPAVKLTSDSTQIREESAAEGMRHQPDYNVAIDYRTSCVSIGIIGTESYTNGFQQLLSHPQARHGWK